MSRPTFEINGRTYDTLTGAMLGHQRSAVSAPAGTVSASPRSASLDGIVGAKPQQAQAATQTLRTAQKPGHIAARQPQPAKTLMRRAVKAPATASMEGMVASPSGKLLPKVAPKLSSSVIDPRRAQVASTAGRNQSVQRFGSSAVPRPVWNPSAATSTSVSGITLAPSTATQLQPRPVAAKPQAPIATSRQFNEFAGPTRRPSAQASSPQVSRVPVASRPAVEEDDNDLFTQALAHATSHEEAAPDGIKTRKSGRRRKQIVGIAASMALFFGLVGFVGFQNRDDIRLQMASAKAGFSASAPLYKPDGYALASMKSAAGSVDSVYSQGNTQNFTISQKKSNWDSQTLLENFVATNNGDYQGFQSNGRTVYVYGKGNATWVNGGIWYQIKTDGDMQAEQLVKIAASM